MIRQPRLEISGAAALLGALAYFFDGSGLVSAAMPAAAVHELGHLLALRLCKRRITRFRVCLTGLELDYAPGLEGGLCALCAAAGPLAGLLFALAACATKGEFWRLSGAVSLALSAFNLLPSLPLDGGRIAGVLLPERCARIVSRVTACALSAFGLWAVADVHTVAPALAGAWLVWCNFLL